MSKTSLFILILLLLSACSAPALSPQNTPTSAMKGYELYGWQTDGKWDFALLVGTNRLKSAEEIKNAAVVVEGMDALQGKLAQLPHGETVIWVPLPGSSSLTPPTQIYRAIQAACEQGQLNCHFPVQ